MKILVETEVPKGATHYEIAPNNNIMYWKHISENNKWEIWGTCHQVWITARLGFEPVNPKPIEVIE